MFCYYHHIEILKWCPRAKERRRRKENLEINACRQGVVTEIREKRMKWIDREEWKWKIKP